MWKSTKSHSHSPQSQWAAIKPFLLAGFSGCTLALCYPPFNLTWLCWVALIPLILASLGSKTPLRAAAIGALFGAVFSWITLGWMIKITPTGWVATAWIGIFPALWAASLQILRKNSAAWWFPLTTGGIWALIETLRTGFPPYGCNPLATSTSLLPLLQICAIGGQASLSALIAATNVTLALQWGKPQPKKLGILILIPLAWAYGEYKLQATNKNQTTVPIATIPSDFSPPINTDQRWEMFLKQIDATKKIAPEKPALTIWAEVGPFPILSHQNTWDQLQALEKELPGALILTSALYESGEKYNALFLVDNNFAQVYRKQVLAPKGEYIPHWLPEKWKENRLSPGKNPVILETKGLKIGPLICLEEIVPQLSLKLARMGAQILVCPSNNATTGLWCAAEQEKMGRLRSIETGLPMIRVANQGISSITDAQGRYVQNTTKTTPTLTKVSIETYPQGTIYTRYPTIAFSLFLILGIIETAIHLSNRYAHFKQS